MYTMFVGACMYQAEFYCPSADFVHTQLWLSMNSVSNVCGWCMHDKSVSTIFDKLQINSLKRMPSICMEINKTTQIHFYHNTVISY